MAWFAAHAITYFKLKSGVQDVFTVWENVILIEADDFESARIKADECAKRDEGDDDGSLTVDGQSATCVFSGIRKVLSVSHCLDDGKLNNGDEITYSEFQVDSEQVVRDLADGKEVAINYYE